MKAKILLLCIIVKLLPVFIQCMLQANASIGIQCERFTSPDNLPPAELRWSYDLFPELSHPMPDRMLSEQTPAHTSEISSGIKGKRKHKVAGAFSRTRRMSFKKPQFKDRLDAAINAYSQLKKHGATYLVMNGHLSEKITNMSVICDMTKISVHTLRNHVTPGRIKKSSYGSGPRAVLGEAAEQQIVEYIVWMDNEGWPLSWRRIRVIARDVAKRNGVDSFSASNRWKNGFKRRHPELSTRLAENMERTRVGGMNKEQTQKYFDTLEKVKALCARLNGEEELAPSLLYNLDEAGVDQVSEMDGDRQVVVLKIKTTPTYRKTSADRTHLSAAVCVAGDGWKAKTMYALKGKIRKEGTLPLCPEGTDYIMTKKGYFDDAGFFEYINL